MKNKTFLVLLGALIMVGALVFGGRLLGNKSADQPIRFCYLVGTEAVPVLVAKNQGFFTEEGLDVKLFNLDQQRGVEYSLVGSNVLDGCATGKIGAIKSASTGMPIKIAGNLLKDEGPPIFTFAVKKSSGIDSLEYFKGRDFGLTFGSGPEYFFDKILEKNRIKRSEVNVLSLPLVERIAAFRSDRLEGIIADPVVFQDLARDYELTKLAVSTEVMPNSYVDGVIFSDDFIKTHPDKVSGIMKALYRANDFINTNNQKNPQLIKDILKKEDGNPGWDKVVLSVYATDSKGLEKGIKDVFSWLKRGGYMTEEVDVNSIIYSPKD